MNTATPARPRTTRIEARLSPDALDLLRRAAEIEGRSLSDFVVTAARQAAEQTLHNAQLLKLSLSDQAFVAELLDRPAPPSPALERAKRRHAELIRSTP
jgi:uncharacterized protein (DUF1778 family)